MWLSGHSSINTLAGRTQLDLNTYSAILVCHNQQVPERTLPCRLEEAAIEGIKVAAEGNWADKEGKSQEDIMEAFRQVAIAFLPTDWDFDLLRAYYFQNKKRVFQL